MSLRRRRRAGRGHLDRHASHHRPIRANVSWLLTRILMDDPDLTQHPIARLMSSRRGHFVFESGHHGNLWLDLESLCLDPNSVRPFAAELASRLRPFAPAAVCGPLVEGAFVALMVAAELGVDFTYAERLPKDPGAELFRYRYHIPNGLRPRLRDRRVAIVNDVIGAGSAVRGTLADLNRVGARTVALVCLMSLGPAAAALAQENDLAFEPLLSLPFDLWEPSDCPLCAKGEPLVDPSLRQSTTTASVPERGHRTT